MKDLLLQLLSEKLSQSQTSAEKRDLILEGTGHGDLAALVLQRAKYKLSEVRKLHFSRPVITLPFSLTSPKKSCNLTDADEFREMTYKSNVTVEDEPFQVRRYLTIHSILRSTIHANERMNSGYELIDTQIVLDGIKCNDYAITQRTSCPVHSYQSKEVNLNDPHLYIVDLFYSTQPIRFWLNCDLEYSCSDIMLLVPYERDMWHFDAGISHAGGYRFIWTNNPHYDNQDHICVNKLNATFFSSSNFSNRVLLIMPHGSNKCLIITRSEFLELHVAHYAARDYSTIRYNRNGFVAVSRDMISASSIAPPENLSPVDFNKLNLGYSYFGSDLSQTEMILYYNMLYNTRKRSGYYVPSAFVDFVKQVLFSVEIDEHYIIKSMNYILAFSKRLCISNESYTFVENLSPTLLCLLIESCAPEVLRIRSKLLNMALATKLNSIAEYCSKIIMPYMSPAERSSNIDRIIHNVQSNNLEDSLIHSAQRAFSVTSISMQKVRDTNQQQTVDRIKHLVSLLSHIESLFPTSAIHVDKFVRTPIPSGILDAVAITVNEALVHNPAFEVTIDSLQAIYDDLFPGNSAIDYTAMQSQAELADKSIVLSVPKFRVSYANIYSDVSERLLIPSKLRTSTAADLTGSFYNMMNALMKRNFNRQAAEMSGDRRHHVRMSILNVFSSYGVSSWRELLAYFNSLPISPGIETLDIWASKHTESDVKAADAIMKTKLADPSHYNAMPKNQAKPILDLTAQGSLAVGQTVVFHSKDVISLSVGVFTLMLERLMLLFPTSVRLAFAADEHTVGEWADNYLDLSDTFVYEFDVPKFDKSQDMMCFTLILEVMTILGVSDEFVTYWRRASYEGTIFNSCFSMVFTLFYGNRSGSGGTLAVNCICLLFAFFTEFSSLQIVAALIKGDDSVLVTRREITNDHVIRLLERWGFSLKRRQINKYVSFCSGLFVKNSNDKYMLLRDPVRLLTKLGRALSPERESSYFIDYYISFVDATAQYADDIAIQNLKSATYSLYNKTIDVDSIIQFLRIIVKDYKTFLRILYGFNNFSLMKVTKLDGIKDVLLHAKIHGFIKSKMLHDKCPNLKIPLAEKIRNYANEIIIDSGQIENQNSKLLTEDMVDKLGWIHSII